MRTRTIVTLFSALLLLPCVMRGDEPVPRESEAAGASEQAPQEAAQAPVWYEDYSDAVRAAQKDGKMLLILFVDPGTPQRAEGFREEVLECPQLAEPLSRYVLLKLRTDSAVETAEGPCALLQTAPLSEMLGLDGVAIADYSDGESEDYESIISVFPFLGGQTYDLDKTKVILELPPGSLTQRTLIYAVRVHPERPQSAQGQCNANLRREARWHSGLMARLRRSGHHQWETRFHRINGEIPRGLTATEVAAESWPGQRLLAAAIECVRCWRLSSGHWRSVRAYQPCYGYDMKRGDNGVWYATGIFGARTQY